MIQFRSAVRVLGGVLLAVVGIDGTFYRFGWAASHQTAVANLFWFSALGAFVCGVTYLLADTKSSTAEEVVSGTSVTSVGGNKGLQWNASHSPTAIGDKAIEALYLTPTAQSEKRWPKLECEQVATLRVSYDEFDGDWKQDQQNGAPYIFLKVYFPPQECDAQASFYVRATLRFKEVAGYVEQINRAYWLDHSANSINLHMGEYAYVLLGTVESGRWISFANKYDSDVQKNPMYDFDGRELSRKIDVQGPCHGVVIMVSVFNQRAGEVAQANLLVTCQSAPDYQVEFMP